MANTRRMTFSHEAGRHRPDQPTVARLCPFEVNLSLSRLRRARLVNWLVSMPSASGAAGRLLRRLVSARRQARRRLDGRADHRRSNPRGPLRAAPRQSRLGVSLKKSAAVFSYVALYRNPASVHLVRASCADSRSFLYSEAGHMLLFWVSALAACE